MRAAHQGNQEIVKQLLEKNVELEQQDIVSYSSILV